MAIGDIIRKLQMGAVKGAMEYPKTTAALGVGALAAGGKDTEYEAGRPFENEDGSRG